MTDCLVTECVKVEVDRSESCSSAYVYSYETQSYSATVWLACYLVDHVDNVSSERIL